jgi:nucleoside-diphosphate-sugar epimerase
LPRIGDGKTQLDLTYIDNLVLALILAADSGNAGQTYTITNDEPVRIWRFLEDVLGQLGRSRTLPKISRTVALQAAGLCERWHRWKGKCGEPAATKYTVGLLSTIKTFDIFAGHGQVDFSPDGKLIACAASRPYPLKTKTADDVKLYDVQTGKLVKTLDVDP